MSHRAAATDGAAAGTASARPAAAATATAADTPLFFPQQPHIDVPDWSLMSEEKKISLFNAVLAHYREPGLQRVLPRHVIPDTTNRSNTGLSVQHVHWVASKMQKEGFTPRSSAVHGGGGGGDRRGRGGASAQQGHDLPIVVRESTYTEYGPESLLKWQLQLQSEPGFAPLRLKGVGNGGGDREGDGSGDGDGSDELPDRVEFFGSLGNGHFFQVCVFRVRTCV
jgi:hypothetical protein